MAFAFSTATSNATFHASIDTLAKKMGVSKKDFLIYHSAWGDNQYGRNRDYAEAAVVFVAQAFGIQRSFTDYVTVIGTATLASIGTAGVCRR